MYKCIDCGDYETNKNRWMKHYKRCLSCFKQWNKSTKSIRLLS